MCSDIHVIFKLDITRWTPTPSAPQYNHDKIEPLNMLKEEELVFKKLSGIPAFFKLKIIYIFAKVSCFTSILLT